MKKMLSFLVFFSFLVARAPAQIFMTRTGFVSFYSKTPMEDIEAKNQQLLAVINVDKKELAFTVLIKGFEFKKELMQTHFNENYAESDKYPKASFTGTYTLDDGITTGAAVNTIVKGSFTLHGVTKPIEVPATLQLTKGLLAATANFNVAPEDYNIVIPNLVRNKIARQVAVDIKVTCNQKN